MGLKICTEKNINLSWLINLPIINLSRFYCMCCLIKKVYLKICQYRLPAQSERTPLLATRTVTFDWKEECALILAKKIYILLCTLRLSLWLKLLSLGFTWFWFWYSWWKKIFPDSEYTICIGYIHLAELHWLLSRCFRNGGEIFIC